MMVLLVCLTCVALIAGVSGYLVIGRNRYGGELLIGLSGVQSNQYPRGRDLGLQFVAHGLPTMMGGFHVSGYPESVKFLNRCGITTIVGEAENLWGQIIEDFLRGELQPHYS